MELSSSTNEAQVYIYVEKPATSTLELQSSVNGIFTMNELVSFRKNLQSIVLSKLIPLHLPITTYHPPSFFHTQHTQRAKHSDMQRDENDFNDRKCPFSQETKDGDICRNRPQPEEHEDKGKDD